MGKNGERLRAAKLQKTRTITEEWLREHDRQVVEAYKQTADRSMRKTWDEYDHRQREEFDAHIKELWADRERRFKTGYQQGDVMAMASAMMSVTIKVLCEEFRWVPVRNEHKTRLRRFSEAVIDEMNRIGQDETIDIVRYADEVEKNYGVSFKLDDDEDG